MVHTGASIAMNSAASKGMRSEEVRIAASTEVIVVKAVVHIEVTAVCIEVNAAVHIEATAGKHTGVSIGPFWLSSGDLKQTVDGLTENRHI